MSMSDEIQRLEELRANGTLSEEEFREAKAKVIHDGEPGNSGGNSKEIHGVETNLWCAGIHFSQLLNIFPSAGFIIPIVLWVMGKEKSHEANAHGTNVVNWLISSAIYLVVSCLLLFAVIGIALVPLVLLLMFVFPIIGGIKALNGEYWKYPLTIEFLTPPYVEEEFGDYVDADVDY